MEKKQKIVKCNECNCIRYYVDSHSMCGIDSKNAQIAVCIYQYLPKIIGIYDPSRKKDYEIPEWCPLINYDN